MKVVFSPEVSTIAGYAREEAMRTGSYGISADHLMLAMIRHEDNGACRILSELGVGMEDFKDHLDSRIFKEKPVPYDDYDKIRLSRGAQSVLNMAAFEALRADSHEITPEHMLLALVRDADCCSSQYLSANGVSREKVLELMGSAQKTPAGKPQEKTEPSVPVKDIAGALGEQLGNVLESISKQSNIFS